MIVQGLLLNHFILYHTVTYLAKTFLPFTHSILIDESIGGNRINYMNQL